MQYPFSDIGIPDTKSISPNDNRVEFSAVPETPEQKKDTEQLPNIKQRVRLAENDHENLHKITHLLIYTSGFLLTICLGAIYFSYSNNSSTHLPVLTKILLFFATFSLSFAVLASVRILHLSPRVSLGNAELAEMLEDVCDNEKWWTDWASRFLQFAIGLLLVGIILFAGDLFFKSPDIISDLENITHTSIEITRSALALAVEFP